MNISLENGLQLLNILIIPGIAFIWKLQQSISDLKAELNEKFISKSEAHALLNLYLATREQPKNPAK